MFSHLRLLSINEMQILKLISPQEMENNDDQNTFHAYTSIVNVRSDGRVLQFSDPDAASA